MAQSTHKFIGRGVIAPAIVKPADTQEDNHVYPLVGVMNAPPVLVVPSGDDTYKCAKSYKPKLSFGPKKEGSSASENSSKPGCGSVPLALELEYRFNDALRLSYSRFNLPSSNYSSVFVSPITGSGLTGVETSGVDYHLHQTRTKYGAMYAHPVTDAIRLGAGVSAVKEFFHYEISQYSAGSAVVSPRGFLFTNFITGGQRDRILSGSAPGVLIEANVSKKVMLYANYERFVLKGSSAESTLGGGIGYVSNGTTAVGVILIGGLDSVNQKLEHSGHETTLGIRLGETNGFHFALTERKFVRNITEYTTMNTSTALLRGISGALTDSLNLSNIYRWHRYVQTEKYLQMKLEMGTSF